MKIGYFCYSLSGTGPSTRAADIINGIGNLEDHEVVVLTNEPENVTAPVETKYISLDRPLRMLRLARDSFGDVDVVHVPINVYQVLFVRLVYWGPLVAGVGPGIQPSLFHRCLGRLLGIDKKIKVYKYDQRWEKVGYDTEICTATIHTDYFHPYAEEEVEKLRDEYGFADDAIIVLYVGKLTEGQGAHIVDQMARIKRDDPSWQFVVIGDGAMEETFQDRNDLRFEGFVDNKSLPDYYNMADVTVAPREEDNTSNVGLESIAAGTPVITTADGDIRLLFEERGTYVWSDRTPEAVISTVRDLVEDPESYENQVERGLTTIDEMELTLETALDTHIDVYEELAR